jgi:hypothetical protein
VSGWVNGDRLVWKAVGGSLEESWKRRNAAFPSLSGGRIVRGMDFRLLGPVEVTDGQERLPLGGPKPRTLLAHLVLELGRVVPAERLIDAVWDERPPPAARNTLQTYVSHLRRQLVSCNRSAFTFDGRFAIMRYGQSREGAVGVRG